MAKRRVGEPPRRRKRTLTLSVETSTRLSIEAERRGVDRSTAADQILAESLRHIVVSIRTREGGQSESAA